MKIDVKHIIEFYFFRHIYGLLIFGSAEYSRCNFAYYTPANKVWGVYSDPYVRPFVRPFGRPSQSLIRYSSKTAEQNFMKLSGIVH